MRITWVGCHSEGLKSFKAFIDQGIKVDGFITLNDKSFEKRSAGAREYIEMCGVNNIPVYYVSTIKNDESYSIIKALNPDLLIVIGWSEILPERILDIPSIGTVGTHASLLPSNRGSAPVNWALIRGERQWGNSLIRLVKDVDKGDIIDQERFDISIYDTCKTVYEKVSDTNAVMLTRLVRTLSEFGNVRMHVANVSDEPLLPRRRPKDGLMDWNQSSKIVYDFIRALTKPYPGAFTYLSGKKYIIWSASILPENTPHKPGTIIGSIFSPIDMACGLQVGCSEGSVIIHEIEDERGKTYVGRSLSELHMTGSFTSGD